MKNCLECLSDFTTKDYRQKFCSRQCSARYNNKKRGLRVLEGRFCLNCNASLKKHQKKFCGRICSAKYGPQQYISKWLLGENDGSKPQNGDISKTVRDYLLEEAGQQCTLCGWGIPNPKLGKPILTVDHIDGNWKNNSVSNLVVLCYNCHTLTPTFNHLNVGNGAGFRGSAKRFYAPLG